MAADERPDGVPGQGPIEPRELGADASFRFDCHPGVACFNACCRNTDIQLLPYDLIRLKQRLGLTAGEFVATYTVPFEMDHHGLPGLKLAMQPDSAACIFLAGDGCSVYADRPTACRYYALGSMDVRKAGEARLEQKFFVVREAHCKGHEEPKTQTVREYRKAQALDIHDYHNRGWRELIVKKRSSGPAIGKPSARSIQLFDMCSYDMDSFRAFIQSDGFRRIFDLPEEEFRGLLEDEVRLLHFGYRFLRQVLFGEMSIPLRPGAREQRAAERQAVWASRRAAEINRYREQRERTEHEE